MSIRHLDTLFDPASVAVVGDFAAEQGLGRRVWRRLRDAGFERPLHAVNRGGGTIDGAPLHAGLEALPQVPALALVCAPRGSVVAIVEQLAHLGTQAAVLLGERLAPAQRQAALAAARPRLLRLLGTGGGALVLPRLRLNASAAPVDVAPGDVAFVGSSPALLAAVLDWAQARGIGLSHALSLGEQCDVDVGDALDWLASDPDARSILLQLDDIVAAPKFMSAARAAARTKRVIAVRSGAADDRAADRVVDAALARAGVLRVDSLLQLFTAAETLARLRSGPGDALALVGNSRAGLQLAADAAAAQRVAAWSPDDATRRRLQPPQVRPFASGIDLGDDADVEGTVDALRALLDDPGPGAVLLVHAPSARLPAADLADVLPALAEARPGRLLACRLGRDGSGDGHGIAAFATPEQAVLAFAMLQRHRRNQAQLLEAPAARAAGTPPDVAAARAIVQQALADGRSVLSASAATALLAAYRCAAADDATAAPSDAPALRIGACVDPVFGPVLDCGQGGPARAWADDTAVALPPLNGPLARALLERTRIGAWLLQSPQAPAGAAAEAERALIALSQLLADVPAIARVDIDPLHGAGAARRVHVELDPHGPAGALKFAIRPYPGRLAETIDWQGRRLTLRPIRPGDEAQHLRFLESLSPQDIRFRIFYSRRSIGPDELARLTQIDYAREMAFVAVAADAGGGEETLGVVRATCDPDNVEAEFGVVVRSDLKGGGLGAILMRKLMRYLRSRGTQWLVGSVLDENRRMLELSRELGFEDLGSDPAEGTHRIRMAL